MSDYSVWAREYKPLKGAELINRLISDLSSRDVEERERAASALVEFSQARAFMARSWNLHEKRIWEDYGINDEALSLMTEPLINALRDKNVGVCDQIIRALAFIRTEAAVEPLIKVLRGGTSVELRASAAWALGWLGDERSISPLLDALHNDDSEVKSRASWALGERGGSGAVPLLISALASPNGEVVRLALGALRQLKDTRAVAPVIDLLQLPHASSSFHEEAIRVLEALGDQRAVKPLLSLLLCEVHEVHHSAAKALGELGDTSVVPYLIETLSTMGSSVRCRAIVDALGCLRSGEATEPLIDLVGSNRAYSDISLTSMALSALGNIRDPRALSVLIKFCRHSESQLRYHATVALGKLGDKRAFDAIMSRLSDEDSWIRGTAVSALGDLRDLRAIQPIIERLLTDPSVDVRLDAADVLGNKGDESALAALRQAAEQDHEYSESGGGESVADLAYEAIFKILSRLEIDNWD
jgi:HEAT repeat protein